MSEELEKAREIEQVLARQLAECQREVRLAEAGLLEAKAAELRAHVFYGRAADRTTEAYANASPSSGGESSDESLFKNQQGSDEASAVPSSADKAERFPFEVQYTLKAGGFGSCAYETIDEAQGDYQGHVQSAYTATAVLKVAGEVQLTYAAPDDLDQTVTGRDDYPQQQVGTTVRPYCNACLTSMGDDGLCPCCDHNYKTWYGGDCPVEPFEFVDIVLRAGGGEGGPAGDMDWAHSIFHTHPNDIVLYRLQSARPKYDENGMLVRSDEPARTDEGTTPPSDGEASSEQSQRDIIHLDASDLPRLSRCQVPFGAETFRSEDGAKLFAKIAGQTHEVVDDEPEAPIENKATERSFMGGVLVREKTDA